MNPNILRRGRRDWRKISLIFVETGAKVVLVDINEEGIKRVSQICKKASPHNYDVKYLL